MSTVRSEIVGQSGTILVVHLPGAVVDETAVPIREEVIRRLPNADGAGVVLDCRDVYLVNSIGITCLLQIQDHCRRQGAGMSLAGVPPTIASFLRQLKLDTRFTRHESPEEAVAALDRARA
jgi:anti-anti-sigma factor